MAEPFSVRIAVRSYELDSLGHLNQAVYHSYAEHSRVELFRRAGVPQEVQHASGAVPVLLESRCRYLRELRSGDEVDVSCEVAFGEGKTFHMTSTMRKPDGTVAAEITCLLGLMDLHTRRLVADPRTRLTEHATDPAVLLG